MAPVQPSVLLCDSGHEPSGSEEFFKVYSVWVLELSEVNGWLDNVVSEQKPTLRLNDHLISSSAFLSNSLVESFSAVHSFVHSDTDTVWDLSCKTKCIFFTLTVVEY